MWHGMEAAHAAALATSPNPGCCRCLPAPALQVLLLMQAAPLSEDDRLAKAALFTKFTGGIALPQLF